MADQDVRTYLLPDDGRAMLATFRADLAAVQHHLRLVSYLPPCGRLAPLVEAARARLGPAAVQVVADATTHASLGRFDVDWIERRRLRAGGTLHCKVAVVDRVLWWGSWNLAASAVRQYDVVQRLDPGGELLDRVLAWLDLVPGRTDLVACGEQPHGGPTLAPGQERDPRLLGDPDLGW